MASEGEKEEKTNYPRPYITCLWRAIAVRSQHQKVVDLSYIDHCDTSTGKCAVAVVATSESCVQAFRRHNHISKGLPIKITIYVRGLGGSDRCMMTSPSLPEYVVPIPHARSQVRHPLIPTKQEAIPLKKDGWIYACIMNLQVVDPYLVHHGRLLVSTVDAA